MVYNTLPLYHVGGQNMVWMALVSDTSAAMAERFSASRFWDDVRAYGATYTLCLGAMIPILAKQPERPDDHENPLRIALSAAAPPAIWEAFEKRFGARIVELYARQKGDSCSMPMPGRTAKSVPWASRAAVTPCEWWTTMNRDLPAGEVGELVYRSTTTDDMPEYYKNPEATAEKESRRLDPQWRPRLRGRGWVFFFVDRKNDFMRRRGENVSSYEVESVVNGHEQVLESAAYALPSDLEKTKSLWLSF